VIFFATNEFRRRFGCPAGLRIGIAAHRGGQGQPREQRQTRGEQLAAKEGLLDGITVVLYLGEARRLRSVRPVRMYGELSLCPEKTRISAATSLPLRFTLIIPAKPSTL
jgi:hypothetical protein